MSELGYTLGIDLGTTFTAAAVFRDGRAEVVPLGNHAATIPSLVFLRDDETVIIGDAADRRGQQEPARLAREFKRRFGDSTPILLDRTPFSAERLMGVMLRQVLGDIVARQGSQPDGVGVAHPANWGQFKIDLLRQAMQMAGAPNAVFVTEPIAAAIQYASSERVDTGEVVAVYDLGGGTFDAAVLRKTATGFEAMGQPQGIERLGGIDFDEAVFGHVRRTIGNAVDRLDTNDPSTRSALARLRQECVSAKETLSSDSDATIPVLLPNVQTQVRITRSEFEDMIRPTLRETIETTKRALAISGVPPHAIKAVLLAGGSSRIPLIAEMVRGEFALPVVTDLHPKHAVALGAARFAAQSAGGVATPPAAAPTLPVAPLATATATQLSSSGPAPIVPSGPPPVPSMPAAAASQVPTQPVAAQTIAAQAGRATQPTPVQGPVPAPGSPQGPAGPGGPGGSGGGSGPKSPKSAGGSMWSKPWVLAVAGLVAIGIGVGAVLALSGNDKKGSASTSATTTTAASDTTAADNGTPTTSPSTTPSTETATTDSTNSTEEVTTSTEAPTTTVAPSLTCSTTGDGLCDGITKITLTSDKTFVVDYQVSGFTPIIGGGHHVHFFYDTVPPDQAGMPGAGPWAVWDLDSAGGQFVFNEFTVGNINEFHGIGAKAICIAVANDDHSIDQTTIQCSQLDHTLTPAG